MVTLESAKIGLQSNATPQATPHTAPAVKATPAPAPIEKPEFKTNVSDIITEKVRRTLASQMQEQIIERSLQQEQISRRTLEDAAEKMKRLAEYIAENTHLLSRDYRVHEGTNRISVKIYDSVTGEVIREVPGQEFLDRVAKMEQLLGVIFDNLV